MPAPLWMPGAIQIPSSRRITLNNNGYRILTWHTFECPYSWTVRQALQFLINQATEAFVFHPITGEWGQCQPMNTGARTLRAAGAVTNAFGTVHQQVEVIGYAGKPFTNDLTPAGRAGLARGLAFFRQWGIPDQWAWTGVTRPPATYAEMLRFPKRAPDRSGHAFHSGWHGGNMHWDPGAIERPWVAAAPTTPPPVDDVTAPAGSTWEIDTTALNCRSGPGTQYQITGHAERGVTVTATGKASGPWIEAQTPWQRQNNVKAWWHSGFMRRVTTAPPPPKPDPQARRAQELLHELGYDLGKHGVDGFWGPDSDLAARTYGADFGFTFSIPTPIPALLAHLEDTMAKIDDLLTEVRAIRAEQRTSTPAEIARAVWGQQLYGFAAHWQLRQGLITDPAHPNFPADPGSPADKVLRAEALESGRTTTYTPDGPVLLELDQDGRFQIKED